MGTAGIIVVISLLIFGFGGYLFLLLYFPEWVGITGSAARKALKEHEEGSLADDSDPFSSK